MYLLDTNVISELRRPRPHGAVLAWLNELSDSDIHLAAITFGELQVGIEVTREQDPAKALEMESWLEAVANTYNVIVMDVRTFRRWAQLMVPATETPCRRCDDCGDGGDTQLDGGHTQCPRF